MTRQLDKAIFSLPVAFIFAGPLLISPWAFDHALLIKESFLQVVSGTLLVIFFLRVVIGRDIPQRLTPLGAPILVLLGCSVLSIIGAVNLPAATYRLTLFLAGITLYWVAVHSRLHQAWIAAFAKAAVASGLVATIFAFAQYLGLDPLPRQPVGPTSTMGNPNFLAEYIAFVLPLCLGFILSSQGSRRRRLYELAFVLLLAGLLLCKAKAAMLAFLFSFGIFAVLLRRRGSQNLSGEMRRHLGFTVLALIIIGFFGASFVSRFFSPQGARGILQNYVASQAPYLKMRLVFYRDTARMALDNPFFGVGIGNFEYTYPRYRSMPETLDPGVDVLDHAHNDYLEQAAEIGLGGLIAFLWLLWAFFRKMLRSAGDSMLAVAYTSSVGALAVNSLFAFGLYNPIPLAALWASMGLALRTREVNMCAEGQIGPSADQHAPAWAVIIALAAMGGLLYGSIRPLVADAYLSRGDKLLKTGQVYEAIPPLQRAAHLAPARIEAQWKLAQAYAYTGRFLQAIGVLDRYLSVDPYNFRVFYVKGLYAEQAGDDEVALGSYKRAREIYPLYSNPLLRIGLIRERRGDQQGAVDAYREAIRLNPSFGEAFNDLAILLSRQGRLDEAIRVWEEGAQGSPRDLLIAQNLSVAYSRAGNREKALFWAARVDALRMAPKM